MPLINEDDLSAKSLVQADPLTPPNIPMTMVGVVDVDYQATYVDLKWLPRTQLLTHIEGAKWVVDYYSQVITKDSALSGVEVTTSGVYQSYTEIKQLELRVSSVLSTSQDDQTKVMRVGGSAIILPVIIPNVGDMFSAPIGEGKVGVFRVISSVKKSIFQESCYEIGYNLDTDATDKRDALKNKTVLTYYYVKNHLLYGKNPLITTDTFNALAGLQIKYRSVLQNYCNKYISKEYGTLLVGGQGGVRVYDPYQARHIHDGFSVDECTSLAQLRLLSITDDNHLSHTSVWDAFMQQDETILNLSFTKYGLLNTVHFARDPQLRSIYYTGIDKVIYPEDPKANVDEEIRYLQKPLEESTLTSTSEVVVLPYIADSNTPVSNLRGVNLNVLDNQTAPIIYPVTQDTYYIFSSHFYTGDTQMSILEQMVLDFIQRKPVDLIQLSELLVLSQTWPSLEKYYYTPFILLMAKEALNTSS